ncbi:metal-dependent hydrolase [Lentilitoribacter sp. Alg239-R112]|uniref:metal-dependent hydrolase n=1 Tax=Lentilitoribacter sp. Alg239-R112 TaxID=2305987 RepID=UPI0013A70662|nr:metal-dependent hydrolase [Lentilitoribacter sp. Alg239-R112]
MKITWLGHSAFRFEIGNSVILVDPFIKGNPKANINFDEVTAGTTHIALTHGHSDHLGDTVEIAKTTGATVIANADLCSWLRVRNGLSSLEDGNTGGTIGFDDFSVTFVDAKHSSAFITDDGIAHSLGHSNGLMFHFRDAPSVLHMGDTDIFSDMALIQELHEPDIGIVPIGDRYTMGSAVAALSCQKYFKFDKIIPCHFGSFPVLEPSVDQFRVAMGEDGAKVQALGVGESLNV